jgi:hypothetical protein
VLQISIAYIHIKVKESSIYHFPVTLSMFPAEQSTSHTRVEEWCLVCTAPSLVPKPNEISAAATPAIASNRSLPS